MEKEKSIEEFINDVRNIIKKSVRSKIYRIRKDLYEDMEQECYLKLLQNLTIYDLKEKPINYLYVVINNCIINTLFREYKTFQFDPIEYEDNFSNYSQLDYEYNEYYLFSYLKELCSELEYKVILLLAQGKRQMEISNELEISQSKVSRLIYSIRKKITNDGVYEI